MGLGARGWGVGWGLGAGARGAGWWVGEGEVICGWELAVVQCAGSWLWRGMRVLLGHVHRPMSVPLSPVLSSLYRPSTDTACSDSFLHLPRPCPSAFCRAASRARC